jgi:hypothetical protein
MLEIVRKMFERNVRKLPSNVAKVMLKNVGVKKEWLCLKEVFKKC